MVRGYQQSWRTSFYTKGNRLSLWEILLFTISIIVVIFIRFWLNGYFYYVIEKIYLDTFVVFEYSETARLNGLDTCGYFAFLFLYEYKLYRDEEEVRVVSNETRRINKSNKAVIFFFAVHWIS